MTKEQRLTVEVAGRIFSAMVREFRIGYDERESDEMARKAVKYARNIVQIAQEYADEDEGE